MQPQTYTRHTLKYLLANNFKPFTCTKPDLVLQVVVWWHAHEIIMQRQTGEYQRLETKLLHACLISAWRLSVAAQIICSQWQTRWQTSHHSRPFHAEAWKPALLKCPKGCKYAARGLQLQQSTHSQLQLTEGRWHGGKGLERGWANYGTGTNNINRKSYRSCIFFPWVF